MGCVDLHVWAESDESYVSEAWAKKGNKLVLKRGWVASVLKRIGCALRAWSLPTFFSQITP